eukprot:TRINITY_DN41271_c0_g1_i1.p1 TRINITY_DN41271_c0_g1~~TRINITY_DN41271_c0_g1_i1.p1  ORF type:complete len:424 (+),score=52.19 TRINITY_DN41271_c0_g1_i1:193-1464(+)
MAEPMHERVLMSMYGDSSCSFPEEDKAIAFGIQQFGREGLECFRAGAKHLHMLCAWTINGFHSVFASYLNCTKSLPRTSIRPSNVSRHKTCRLVARSVQEKLTLPPARFPVGKEECFKFSSLLWSDMEAAQTKLPWHPLISGQGSVRTGIETWIKSLFNWRVHLYELWFLFDRIASQLWRPGDSWAQLPAFRLPRWPTPHGPFRAAVLVNLILQRRSEVGSSLWGNLTYVEIGVFRGDTSEYVLKHTGHLLGAAHFIDPWEEEHVFRAMSRSQRLSVDADAALDKVQTRLCPLSSAVRVASPSWHVRQRGAQTRCIRAGGRGWPSSTLYPMNSAQAVRVAGRALGAVDVIFIDGAHDYWSVKKDLELWWPRVRRGGFMAGHDFTMGDAGVMQAVWQFFSYPASGRQVNVFLDSDYTWWVQKFE